MKTNMTLAVLAAAMLILSFVGWDCAAQAQEQSKPTAQAPAPQKAQTPAVESPLISFPAGGGVALRVGRSELRVHIASPIAAPYSGSAYRDFGGQPESSADAVMAETR